MKTCQISPFTNDQAGWCKEAAKVLYPRLQSPSSAWIYTHIFLSRLDIGSYWAHTAMLGSCQWAICPQQCDTKVRAEAVWGAVTGTLYQMAASGKGSRSRWLKQREVEWLPKLLCPHFNTNVGHFLSVPTIQHCCQISSVFLPPLPTLLLPAPKKQLHHL